MKTKNQENDKNDESTTLKCCESGCDGCPFEFNKDELINPNFPNELQKKRSAHVVQKNEIERLRERAESYIDNH